MRGYSIVAICDLPKVKPRVRFPLPALLDLSSYATATFLLKSSLRSTRGLRSPFCFAKRGPQKHMKKYTKIIVYTAVYSVIIAVVGYIVGRQAYSLRETMTMNPPSYTRSWSVYKSDSIHLQFRVPAFVTVSPNLAEITLSHSIPFVHNDYCDFVGNKPQPTTLDDVSITFSISDDPLREVLKNTLGGTDQLESVFDESNHFVLQADFVDEFKIGSLIAHRVRYSVEGCGMNYYFIPMGNRTLIAQIPEQGDLYDTSSQYNNYKTLLEPDPYSREQQVQLLKDIVSTMRPLK